MKQTSTSTLSTALARYASGLPSSIGWMSGVMEEASERLRDLDWIPTKDRLPANPSHFQQDSLPCLCIGALGVAHVLYWNFEFSVWDDANGDEYAKPTEVSLWMPVPPISETTR